MLYFDLYADYSTQKEISAAMTSCRDVLSRLMDVSKQLSEISTSKRGSDNNEELKVALTEEHEELRKGKKFLEDHVKYLKKVSIHQASNSG